MADPTPTLQPVPETEEVVVKQSRIKDFTTKHPRITKVAGISAAVAGVVAVVALVRNSNQDADSVSVPGNGAEVVDQTPTTETTQVLGA